MSAGPDDSVRAALGEVGRALGHLAQAVVRRLPSRRRRPRPRAGRPTGWPVAGGPPQHWLDYVAAHQPDWTGSGEPTGGRGPGVTGTAATPAPAAPAAPAPARGRLSGTPGEAERRPSSFRSPQASRVGVPAGHQSGGGIAGGRTRAPSREEPSPSGAGQGRASHPEPRPAPDPGGSLPWRPAPARDERPPVSAGAAVTGGEPQPAARVSTGRPHLIAPDPALRPGDVPPARAAAASPDGPTVPPAVGRRLMSPRVAATVVEFPGPDRPGGWAPVEAQRPEPPAVSWAAPRPARRTDELSASDADLREAWPALPPLEDAPEAPEAVVPLLWRRLAHGLPNPLADEQRRS